MRTKRSAQLDVLQLRLDLETADARLLRMERAVKEREALVNRLRELRRSTREAKRQLSKTENELSLATLDVARGIALARRRELEALEQTPPRA